MATPPKIMPPETESSAIKLLPLNTREVTILRLLISRNNNHKKNEMNHEKRINKMEATDKELFNS